MNASYLMEIETKGVREFTSFDFMGVSRGETFDREYVESVFETQGIKILRFEKKSPEEIRAFREAQKKQPSGEK